MNVNHIKMLYESYMAESTRPDGSKCTTGEYMRFVTDCNLEFVTSKDMVIMDDANEAVHCVCYNEDGFSQSAFPIKIISAPYEDIHSVETIMSPENFEKFLNDGFFKNIPGFSADKKNFMLKWSKGIKNKAQKTPPQHSAPYYKDSPVITSVNSEEDIIAALAAGKNITLASDIELEETLVANGDCTINLNNKVLTAPNGKRALEIKGGNVTIKNGTIAATATGSDAIYMNAIADDGGAPSTLNIDRTAYIIAQDCCVLMKGKATLNSNGLLTSIGDYAAIQGNGTAGGITVNVTGGSVTSKDIAIYIPCKGKLNISGDAQITGSTAIYQKSGEMYITGAPIITGIGEKKDYEHNSNGCNSTGDAIVIEACDYPDGAPIVTIRGGTFKSNNAEAVGYYKQSDSYKMENEKFIHGGKFSSDVSEYVVDTLHCINVGDLYHLQTA